MKKKPSQAYKKVEKIVHHEYEPGTGIIAQNTKYSGVYPGQHGTIVARHPDGGYAVEFADVARISLFGGASFKEPAIIYMEPHEFIINATQLQPTGTPSDQGPTPDTHVEGGPIVDDSSQGGVGQ